MYLKSLNLVNFRNLKKTSLELNPQYNFFCGANAQGKTNLLEAIYYLTCARSFRTSKIANLIKIGEDYFYAQGTALKNNLAENLEVSFKLGEGRKHKYNHKMLKKGEYPWGIIPTLSYNRKDLKLSEEEALFRRQFLDQEISFLSQPYFLHLNRYNRSLKQRNAAIKEFFRTRSEENVFLWDNELAAQGAFLIHRRKEFSALLNVLARLIYRQLTGSAEELGINYRCLLPETKIAELESKFLELLRANWAQEKKVGYTLTGPQRDDLEISINNKDIRQFGSGGQHKSVILTLKLSLIEIVKKETGNYPILLLDDVFSELDKARCTSLMEILKRKKLQVFFTSNQIPDFLQKYFQGKTTCFQVINGEVAST